MPLSEQEQRALDELEAQLKASDPRFASTMGRDPRVRDRQRRRISGSIVLLVGVAFIMVATHSDLPWLAGVGVGAIIVGLTIMFTPPAHQRPNLHVVGQDPRARVNQAGQRVGFGNRMAGSGSMFGGGRSSAGSSRTTPGQFWSDNPTRGFGSSNSGRSRGTSPFMARLEERWERRRRENQGW